TMGMFSLTGISINGVTTIVQPLVMALALCDTVHIFSHMNKGLLDPFPDRRQALSRVLGKVILPCFLTSLTTAIGFLSLSVSKLTAIREFAWIAASGMVFEFLFSFFFLPPLILLFKPERIYRDASQTKAVTTLLAWINALVQKRYRWMAGATCIMVLTAGWYTSRIKVETNPLDYFKKNTSVRKAADFVENRLAGVDTLDISLKANVEDAFKHPSNIDIIEKVQMYVNTLEGVDKSISLNDFLKDMNESFHDEDPGHHKLPESMELISQYLLLYDSDDLEDVINTGFDHARIAVRISAPGTQEQTRIIRQVNDYIKELNHPDIDIQATGRIVQHTGIINTMVNSQVYSLALAAAIIGVIMLLVLRSLPIGFLSFIPNIFPILMNFGIMGAAGIPLNTGTALISVVALGIAVDDTIHFLNAYDHKRKSNASISEAVESVIATKGPAILISSLILSTGFGVVVLGSFIPIIQFGALTACIMLTAMIGDLILLPSILLLKKEHPAGKAFTEPQDMQTAAQNEVDAQAKIAMEKLEPSFSPIAQSFISGVKAYGLNNRKSYTTEAFSRNIGLLTSAEQQQLGDAKVAIPGLGGVGGAHFMTLVRSGVGSFNLADFDVFEPANVNRQYGARVPNFGRSKLDTMVEDGLSVNPFLQIKTFPAGLSNENLDEFLEGVQVVVDSLDFFAFDIRRCLFKRARERG
ncbi:MAG: MMPL family transporter, partial [Desulfatitalea sp.]|nr:ThiF family adenylyltransferase [Desulfatitalea sp.]NNK01772.1 MMPL family transporter [Desulfatitalea sp.]